MNNKRQRAIKARKKRQETARKQAEKHLFLANTRLVTDPQRIREMKSTDLKVQFDVYWKRTAAWWSFPGPGSISLCTLPMYPALPPMSYDEHG